MQTKTVIIKDGDHDKTFYIKKFTATKFMFFTNQILSMLASTDEINPDLIKQFINNKLMTGTTIGDLKADKVNEAVNKEIAQNYFGLMFNIVKSMLLDIDNHQNAILDGVLGCVIYQNGSAQTQLTMHDGEGHVDMLITDGGTLYKLCWEVLKHNYGGFFAADPK